MTQARKYKFFKKTITLDDISEYSPALLFYLAALTSGELRSEM
jgi:hypothetical protein